jgi:hypothetical protein
MPAIAIYPTSGLTLQVFHAGLRRYESGSAIQTEV